MEIFKLFGSVLVETSGAEKSLSNVDSKAKGTMDKLGGFASKAASFGKALAGTVAAIAAVTTAAATALVKQVNETASYGDEIDKQSQRLGFTATEYQEWEHTLQHYGTSLGEVGRQISQLYVDVANGKEDTLEALQNIGITIEEASGWSSEELFANVIKALQGIKDEGDRAAAAEALFGNAAKALNPILNDTAENVDATKDHLSEMNALMSDEAVKASADYQDSVQDVSEAWRGFKNRISSMFIPGLTKLNNYIAFSIIPTMTSWADSISSRVQGAWEGLVDWITGTGRPTIGGFLQSLSESNAAGMINNIMAQYPYLPASPFPWERSQGSHASGLDFVPYQSANVRVHYGEAILNKAQADEYRAGHTGGGNTTINNYFNTVQQTPAEVAAAMSAALVRARWA